MIEQKTLIKVHNAERLADLAVKHDHISRLVLDMELSYIEKGPNSGYSEKRDRFLRYAEEHLAEAIEEQILICKSDYE